MRSVGSAVDLRFRHGRQLFVGGLFIAKVLLKQLDDILAAQLACPRNQVAVTGNLVVLDSLRRGDHSSLDHAAPFRIADQFAAFRQDAVDPFASYAFGFFSQCGEDGVEAADMSLCLFEMLREALF